MALVIFTFVAVPLTVLNQIIYPVALIMVIVSFARRKEAMGGWLLYFYYWICTSLFVRIAEVVWHPETFFTTNLKPDLHLALIMTTLPRLIASLVLVIAALALVKKREWLWVERVRFWLIITTICTGISVGIDHYYFPNSVLLNAARLAGLLTWTIYFFVSRRIHAIFLTKTWRMEMGQEPLNLLQPASAVEGSEGKSHE
jgi:hypothetical protein